MMWGDLGMLYFCIGNEDLKIDVLKMHAYYKLVNEEGCSCKKNNLLQC